MENMLTVKEAFASASDCVIVATSTLELGIDVGDLNRVIQIDAAARHLKPSVTIVRQMVSNRIAGLDRRRVNPRILMNLH